MSCNCKAQNDFKKIASKYGEAVIDNESNNIILIFLKKLLKIIFGIMSGIIGCALFIIMAIPMMIYVMICIFLGLEPVVKMTWIRKQKIKK